MFNAGFRVKPGMTFGGGLAVETLGVGWAAYLLCEYAERRHAAGKKKRTEQL